MSPVTPVRSIPIDDGPFETSIRRHDGHAKRLHHRQIVRQILNVGSRLLLAFASLHLPLPGETRTRAKLALPTLAKPAKLHPRTEAQGSDVSRCWPVSANVSVRAEPRYVSQMRAENIWNSAKWARARCLLGSLLVGVNAGAIGVLTAFEPERAALYFFLLVPEALPAARVPLAVPAPVHTLATRSGCREAEVDR